jgi:tetratricopeptide (TPR) repeat protein
MLVARVAFAAAPAEATVEGTVEGTAEATTSNPPDPIAAAVLQRTRGDLPAAELALRSLASAERGSCRANYELGVTLAWAQKFDDALRAFDACLLASPGFAGAVNGRARTLFWLGRMAEAERVWRAQLTAFPNDLEARFGFAQLMRAQGEDEEATLQLHAVIAADPTQAEARAALRAIAEQPRNRLRIETGAACSPSQLGASCVSGDAIGSAFGKLHWQHQLHSRHGIYFGIAAEAPRRVIDPGLPPLAAPSLRWVPELGYTLRPVSRPRNALQVSLGYRGDYREHLTLHTLPLAIDWRVLPMITLLATARPGYAKNFGAEVFGSIGAQFTWTAKGPLRGAWALAQLFRYQGPAGAISTSPAVRVSVPIGGMLRADASCGIGLHQNGRTLSWTGGIELALSSRMQLIASIQRTTGLAELTSASVASELQF